jgi:hypothetical protein
MSKGSLPKDNSGSSTSRFRLLQLSISILALLLFISVFLLGLGLVSPGDPTEENIATMNMIIIFSSVTWIVCVPLLIIAIMKYRKSELTNPTGLTKLYFRRRDAKQCTICQKHPASKKYHIRNEHNMKEANIDDYFKDCGCDKCAIYRKSNALHYYLCQSICYNWRN